MLAMMFWQDPGVLPFQQRIHDQAGSSNLCSMFAVEKVPGETQFRSLPGPVEPAFIPAALRRGISYFNSEKIHCDRCLEKHHENGRVEYYHQVLVALLMAFIQKLQ